MRLRALLAALLAATASLATLPDISKQEDSWDCGFFNDTALGIRFSGYKTVENNINWWFGIVLPPRGSEYEGDAVIQLGTERHHQQGNNRGWIGLGLNPSQNNGLQLAAWKAPPDDNRKVLVSPRYLTLLGFLPYTNYPINITLLSKGTSASTNGGDRVVVTFICGGCVNPDSFLGSWTANKPATVLHWLYSDYTVSDKGNENTTLPFPIIPKTGNPSDQGSFGSFTIGLKKATVDEDTYAKYINSVNEEEGSKDPESTSSTFASSSVSRVLTTTTSITTSTESSAPTTTSTTSTASTTSSWTTSKTPLPASSVLPPTDLTNKQTDSTSSTMEKAVIGIGITALVGLLAFVLFWLFRRRQNRHQLERNRRLAQQIELQNLQSMHRREDRDRIS